MAHFAKTRVSWGFLTALLSSEMAAIDVKTYKAVNGDEGGTWAPTSAIEIGGGAGGGLTITGASTPLSIAGGGILQIASGCQYLVTSGALWIVDTDATFGANSDVAVNKSFTFENGCTTLFKTGGSATYNSGHTSTWQSGSNFGIQTGCHATISLDSSCTLVVGTNCNFTIQADALADVLLGAGATFALSGGCTSSIGVGTTLNVAGTVLVNSGGSVVIDTGANLTIKEPVIPVGDGRIRKRVLTKSSDAAQSLAIGDCDILYCPPALLSADRKVTMSNTGAATGDIIEIVNYDPTYTLSVYQADGTTLIAYVRKNGTNHWSLRMMYRTASSTWVPIGGDSVVPLRAADPALRGRDLRARDRLVRRRALPRVRALHVGALVVVDFGPHAVRGRLSHPRTTRPRPAAGPRRPASASGPADAVRVALAVRGARLGALRAARTRTRLLLAGHTPGLRAHRPAAVPRVGRARRQRHHDAQKSREDPRHGVRVATARANVTRMPC